MHFTPFILQTLISNVSLDDAQASSQSNSSSGTRLGWVNRESRLNAGSRLASGIGWGSKDNKVTVESVEAWENNLYIGTSDGHIIHYGVEDQISSENSIPTSFQVSKIHLGSGKRIVERIMLFPQISLAVVLCDTALSFYLLPNMEQLPTTNFPVIKGVTCFCHDVSMEGKIEEDGSVKICVMKRRMIHIYSIKDQCTEEKCIQLPDGAITACQYGQFVCLADNQRYKLIDLKEKKLEDVMPYAENKSDRNSSLNEVFKPIITVIGDSEFLLTLPADSEPERGMWEPVRGTLQWQSFPRAIGVELPYVVALLRNNYIEVHNIMDQQVVQSVQLSSKSRTISTGPGIKVQVAGLTEKLKWENVILESSNNNIDNNKTPQQSIIEQANFLATVPTRLIIAGSESVMALAATPLIVQVDSMLDANCVEEALEMAEQAISTATPENVHSERMRHEFNYIHQKSGFIYLGETFFDLAVSLFEKGKTDPRILIRLFPEMREVIGDDDPINMYSGVKAVADRLGSIEDIVSSSMIKNYDPHIKPDIDTSPATQELRKALITNAKDMLQKFLTWDRGQRKSTSNVLTKKDKVILKAVDNALLRLYTESDSEDLLRSLLESENECDLDLCKKVLEENEKFYPLSLLYKQRKEYRKTLEIWQRLIDQENSDLDFPDGLKQMADLLAKLDDQELVWECASWVIHKNEIIGAKIFILQDAKKPLLVDPSTVLQELRSVGKEGLKLFLEYLVDTRKSQEDEHHTEYVLLSIQDIKAESLKKETRLKFDALTKEFTEHKQSGQTYLSFLMNQPIEDSFSQARTRLILFLQSSNRYKADEVLLKLKEAEILKAELAVVYGKLEQHEIALKILINDLKDYRGGEIYCLQAGRVIGIRKGAPKKRASKKVDEKSLTTKRRTLFLTLLKVYLEMDNRDEMVDIVIHLLNTQAVYLDIMEVLSLLPEYWSIEMLNNFLVRSLRQSYHNYREGQILKGLCRGENLMIKYELSQAYQDIGPIIITQNVVCASCKKHISGAEFMRQPNNDIIHVQCDFDKSSRDNSLEIIDSTTTPSTSNIEESNLIPLSAV